MTRKVSILVEGGLEGGLGHIFRSITLAQLLTTSGAEVRFFTKSLGMARELLLETRLETQIAIHDSQFSTCSDILIIDRLDIPSHLTKYLKNFTKKLVLFSCLSKANQYADLVVNADRPPFVTTLPAAVIGTTTYLRGPKYLILREEFNKISTRQISYPPKSVLVLLGGTDPAGLTLPVVSKLVEDPSLSKITVIVGYYPVSEVIEYLKVLTKTRYNGKLEVFQGVGSPYSLMLKSDLVITSPGMSMFESLAINRPVLLFHQNLRQRAEIKELAITYTKKQMELLPELVTDRHSWVNPGSPLIKGLEIGKGRQTVIEEILR